ncbi:MAG TPA: ATP-binding protein [Tepidisphaeraceae bacterium]|jgi:signal transduction histidine kinase|nr:ATP-binding protein [Tepidisphaeraceae bacterium]
MWVATSPGVRRRVPTAVGIAVALALIAVMFWFRLRQPPGVFMPIGYGVPVIIIGAFQNRKLLWFGTAAFVLLSILRFDVFNKLYWDGALVIFDLLLISAILDFWIRTSQKLEAHISQLESANVDLASREEEIARQNEELQSQTEELERQSEELRVANEELAHREKVLEILLSLSRSLHTELSRDQIMSQVCQTLGLLINGPDAAAAIVEQRNDRMLVRCHHGFGDKGIRSNSIAPNESFASLVLTKGRTGYIEDISARPDLQIPQPVEGEPMVAILATPLRVRGAAVGSLEVYNRHKTSWSQEQVALIESLAAQVSVSLEAAQLFESVTEERNRFETVLRTAPVAVAVCNADCSYIRLNSAGAALLNVPVDQRVRPEEITGLWRAYRGGRMLEAAEYPLLRAALRGEETRGEELEMVLADGRRIVCLNYARPIREGQGAAQGAVSVFVEITVQKELQRELDTRRREAEEASVRKTRFLAAVSHDIRTPANAISLLAELIRRTASNPAMSGDIPELAQELHASAVSLVNLLSDVLDVARFDSDKVELQESEFPLTTLLADEQRQLLPLARQKGLSLQFNAPSESLQVRTDRIKLGRVLGNLIGNAIKFTETGEVRIDAHRNGDNTIRISIVDTGIGIAPEHMSHIFDEFFQLRNPERDRAKGSGLGLTICKRLVDAMGGTLDVQSAPGRGSTFTLTLPAYATVPGMPANPSP